MWKNMYVKPVLKLEMNTRSFEKRPLERRNINAVDGSSLRLGIHGKGEPW